MTTTAQRILSERRWTTFAEAQELEAVARDLAIHTDAPNCYDRTWSFRDGSTLTKTRDGYTAGCDRDSDAARLDRMRQDLRAQGPALVGSVAAAVAERMVAKPGPEIASVIVDALTRELTNANDNAARARAAFRNCTPQQMNEVYGYGDSTRRRLLDDYEMAERKLRDALAWARTLL